jgi:hypothetical protein
MNSAKANLICRHRTFVRERSGWHSWGLSVTLHLFVITTLILIWIRPQGAGMEPNRTAGIALTVMSADQLEAEYLLAPNLDQDPQVAAGQRETSSSPSQADHSFDFALSLEHISAPFDFPGGNGLDHGNPLATLADANSMLQSVGEQRSRRGTELSPEDQRRIEEEQALVESRKPVGEPISISVFGSGPLTGRKFVFVIDRSGSMGTGGLGVLSASVHELSREIEKLHDYHQFQIVAYNDRVKTIVHQKLLFATSENKRKVEEFLINLVAVGGSNHQGGLMAGLSFEPDVVVLLSDGGEPPLQERQLNVIRRSVGGRTQIHCLQFGVGEEPADSNPFMRRLAEQNQGAYRYIDVSKWSQKIK